MLALRRTTGTPLLRSCGFTLALLVGLSESAAGAEPVMKMKIRPAAETASARSWSRLAAESWLRRADNLVRRGETAAAITAYSEAVRADASLGRPYLGLAEIRRLQGDFREAELLLTRATSLPEVRAVALLRRAELYQASGRESHALADRQALAQLHPSPENLRPLAQQYVKRRAWVAALSVWRKLRLTLLLQDPESDLGEVNEMLAALTALAAETDAVQHDFGERNWVRRALRRHAHP